VTGNAQRRRLNGVFAGTQASIDAQVEETDLSAHQGSQSVRSANLAVKYGLCPHISDHGSFGPDFV